MSLQFSDDIIARKFLEMCNDVQHIKTSQEDTRKRLFGGDGEVGAISYLHNEIKATNVVVAQHTGQFRFYRGAVAVLTVLWTAAIAFATAVIGKHH